MVILGDYLLVVGSGSRKKVEVDEKEIEKWNTGWKR